MNGLAFVLLVLFALVAYSYADRNFISHASSYEIPAEYRGVEGLNYVRQNYGSQMSQAQGLCSSQFKGSWIDSSNVIGCYSMQGFSTMYCGIDAVRSLIESCRAIGGSPVCSSDQISCTV